MAADGDDGSAVPALQRLALLDDPTYQAVLDCFLRGQPVIPFDICHYRGNRFARLACNELGDALPSSDDLLRLNGDIAGLAADAAAGLMNQKTRVRQAE